MSDEHEEDPPAEEEEDEEEENEEEEEEEEEGGEEEGGEEANDEGEEEEQQEEPAPSSRPASSKSTISEVNLNFRYIKSIGLKLFLAFLISQHLLSRTGSARYRVCLINFVSRYFKNSLLILQISEVRCLEHGGL